MKMKRVLQNKAIKNGIWLYILLFVNTVLPMLTVPFVTRVLGPEKYGIYTIALNWITYLTVIVTYGFDLSASRRIAQGGFTEEELRSYVSSVIYAKMLLTVISAICMFVLIIGGGYSGAQTGCFLILFGSVIGECFKQTWLFQGLQVMKNITIISSVARILSTVCVFGFVNSEGLFIYSGLYSASGLFVGLVGLLITRFKLKIRFVKVDVSEVVDRLKEGFLIFTTNAMSKIFAGFSITFLSIVATSAEVGVYSAIYKIPQILLSCFAPISQAFYPFVCNEYNKSYRNGKIIAVKVGALITSLSVMGTIGLIVLRKFVVGILFGAEYILYADLLIPFLVWLCLSIGNNFLGTQILIASNHSREYTRSFTMGLIVLLFCTSAFGIKYQMSGVAWAQVVSETVLMCGNIYGVYSIKTNEK